MIYIPFLWEYIVIPFWTGVIPLVLGISYAIANYAIVKSTDEPVYSLLTWEDAKSYVYAIGCIILLIIGFVLGWWFSRIIQKNYPNGAENVNIKDSQGPIQSHCEMQESAKIDQNKGNNYIVPKSET